MQVDDIRRLVKLVEESDIDELEVRRWWEVLRIIKRAKAPLIDSQRGNAPAAPPAVAAAPAVAAVPAAAPSAPAAPAPVAAATPAAEGDGSRGAGEAAAAHPGAAVDEGLIVVRSPMVGTFYRAPNPTAAPYVDVGARVAVRQVVCIVEAMKLMNEIESDVSGTIEKILVENGKPVEYNQPLFLVRAE